MKRKVEQDRIPSWRQTTDAQSAAIQAYSLTLAPVATPGGGRAALWQTHTIRGRRFTECLDFLLKDLAKQHRKSLERITRARGAPILPGPTPAGNDRKLSQSSAFTLHTLC